MCSRTLLGAAIRPHYLLHVVLHGKGEFFYQEKKYELSAGDAFLIEPMQTHYYQADKKDPWEYAWVGFDGSCVEEVLSSTIFQSSPVFTTDSALCIQPMIRLNALFFAPEKNPLGLASAFLRLLSCMTRLDTSGRNDHNEQYYQQALEYISNNYSYNLKIQDIADISAWTELIFTKFLCGKRRFLRNSISFNTGSVLQQNFYRHKIIT